MAKHEKISLPDFMSIAKALADENRVRMLMALRRRELYLSQIVELFGLAPSTVSKHMSILKQARLVQWRKSGRWIYYGLAGNEAPAAVCEAVRWVRESLAKEPRIIQEIKQLREILKVDPEIICSRQRQS